MAEYIVNTDTAESRYKAMGADYSEYFEYFKNKIETLFRNPVRERIVRCKDCKFQNKYSFCTANKRPVENLGFCAWGEEKTYDV